MDAPGYYDLIAESYDSVGSYISKLDSNRIVLFDFLYSDFYLSNNSKVSRLTRYISLFLSIGI